MLFRSTGASKPPADIAPAEVEKRQSLWWYLLVAGVAILIVEAWLANRLSKGPGVIASVRTEP